MEDKDGDPRIKSGDDEQGSLGLGEVPFPAGALAHGKGPTTKRDVMDPLPGLTAAGDDKPAAYASRHVQGA
ncbi:hypothetical protein ILT44_15520 [Microvirga sp. BT689]|uniref:hypothetical protein n=1 Tax=Microvirga arvi TaxID=2778731 RepID=UPI00194DE943|nr:hypothetical protein [Microvirga arvi]MBM6581605.1 hypothetical protein [Microvirga arvi]